MGAETGVSIAQKMILAGSIFVYSLCKWRGLRYIGPANWNLNRYGVGRFEGGNSRVLWLIWTAFIVFVLVILAFDLGVFSRGTQTISAKTALFRVSIYFVLALAFTVFVYFAYEYHWFDLGRIEKRRFPESGRDAAMMFFMGYILEQSLSVDNIFVIALILSYFKIPSNYQHRVLLWGIYGALIMRGIMIGVGEILIVQVEFTKYVFGAFLIFTAGKMLFSGENDSVNFEQNFIIRRLRKRLHPEFVEDHFFARINGVRMITPMFLALIVVETTDLVFAVDSIPAVFGLTHDPFLVFTSNVFAILGLRSLYFALADLLDRFHLLKYSLVIILAFVGLKMLIEEQIPANYESLVHVISFALICVTLAGGVIASFRFPEKHEATDQLEKKETAEPPQAVR
jgi:tellurite resistance protein TerC